MNYYDILVQAVGILAMVIALLSFQQKSQKRIVTFQFFSTTLFSLHFLLLGAITGCLLNVIGVVRSFVFAKKGTKWADHILWPILFIAASFGVYFLNFLVLGTQPVLRNFLLELLPVMGMVATTVAFRMEKASQVRLFSIISSPLWLTYNIFNFSLGGILTETFALISILVGILRLDIKRKNQ